MKDNKNDMETKTGEYVKLDNSHVTSSTDKYTDAIDLSNACRQFYQSRKKATESVKEKLSNSGRQRTSKKTTSIDVAMETLRTEMCSLMDQDLSLMKQLLTLNEAIEDLKWQKKYYHSQSSMPESSCNLSESDWSVSETDMYESETDDLRKFPTTSDLASHSRLSRQEPLQDSSSTGRFETTKSFNTSLDISVSSTKGDNLITSNTTQSFESHTQRRLPTHLDLLLDESTEFCDEEQNSFDSGIHEPVHEPVGRKEITV